MARSRHLSRSRPRPRSSFASATTDRRLGRMNGQSTELIVPDPPWQSGRIDAGHRAPLHPEGEYTIINGRRLAVTVIDAALAALPVWHRTCDSLRTAPLTIEYQPRAYIASADGLGRRADPACRSGFAQPKTSSRPAVRLRSLAASGHHCHTVPAELGRPVLLGVSSPRGSAARCETAYHGSPASSQAAGRPNARRAARALALGNRRVSRSQIMRCHHQRAHCCKTTSRVRIWALPSNCGRRGS
jgi:hypothetical protein